MEVPTVEATSSVQQNEGQRVGPKGGVIPPGFIPFEAGSGRTRAIAQAGTAASISARRARGDLRRQMESGLGRALATLVDELDLVEASIEKNKGAAPVLHKRRVNIAIELGKLASKIIPVSIHHSGSSSYVPREIPAQALMALYRQAQALAESSAIGDDGLPVIEAEVVALPLPLPVVVEPEEGTTPGG